MTLRIRIIPPERRPGAGGLLMRLAGAALALAGGLALLLIAVGALILFVLHFAVLIALAMLAGGVVLWRRR